jgi:hypothetical protein
MPRIEDLVTLAAEAALDEAAAAVRTSRFKAAAVAEAERIRLEVGQAREYPSDQGLGTLRLDNANKPAAPVVDDPAVLGEWLAQRDPSLVTVTITVPAAHLADAVDALTFAGVEHSAVATAVPAAIDWVKDRCIVQPDPTTPSGWVALHVDEDRHTTPVPGVSAVKPQPRWALVPDAALKRHRAELAAKEAEVDLGEPAVEVPDLGSPVDQIQDT